MTTTTWPTNQRATRRYWKDNDSQKYSNPERVMPHENSIPRKTSCFTCVYVTVVLVYVVFCGGRGPGVHP